jgi:hypothetical protein
VGDDTLPARLRTPLAWDFGVLWVLVASNLQAATRLARPGSLLLVAAITTIGASGIVRVHPIIAFRACLAAVLSAVAIRLLRRLRGLWRRVVVVWLRTSIDAWLRFQALRPLGCGEGGRRWRSRRAIAIAGGGGDGSRRWPQAGVEDVLRAAHGHCVGLVVSEVGDECRRAVLQEAVLVRIGRFSARAPRIPDT